MKEEPIQHIPYNTEMPTLKLPEYGRCVVQMIEQLKTFADREDRTKQAYKVVKVMALHRICRKGMFYTCSVVIEPYIFSRSSLAEEKDICFYTLCIEDSGWQA